MSLSQSPELTSAPRGTMDSIDFQYLGEILFKKCRQSIIETLYLNDLTLSSGEDLKMVFQH